MRSRSRSSGGVSEQGRRIDQTPEREAADGPCVASMTSLNLLERTNELSDGLIRPFNATREGRRGSISEIPAKTRYRVINDGGMLYQFLGDSVVGLFGVPEGASGYLAHAVECACGLVDIGASVATEWQRQIDQIQPAAGVHVSMTLGDLQVLSLRPLSRTHMGVIGDSINLAARLNATAGCDEIVVSNMLYQRLPDALRAEFGELPPV